MTTEERSLATLTLIGRRVVVQTYRTLGSTVLLQGLTGLVVSAHPIAAGWVKLHLDPTDKVAYLDWSISIDCLTVV